MELEITQVVAFYGAIQYKIAKLAIEIQYFVCCIWGKSHW